MNINRFKVIALTLCLVGLAACQSAPQGQDGGAKDVSTKLSAEQTGYYDSDDIESVVKQSSSLRKEKKYQEALEVLRPVANNPDARPDQSFYMEISWVYKMLGDTDKAEEYIQKAIKAGNTNPDAYFMLGNIMDEKKQPELAGQAYQKSLDLLPEHSSHFDKQEIVNALALALTAQNKYDEAANLLHDAKDEFPDDQSIERNIRIITALQQSNGIPAPKPSSKPQL